MKSVWFFLLFLSSMVVAIDSDYGLDFFVYFSSKPSLAHPVLDSNYLIEGDVLMLTNLTIVNRGVSKSGPLIIHLYYSRGDDLPREWPCFYSPIISDLGPNEVYSFKQSEMQWYKTGEVFQVVSSCGVELGTAGKITLNLTVTPFEVAPSLRGYSVMFNNIATDGSRSLVVSSRTEVESILTAQKNLTIAIISLVVAFLVGLLSPLISLWIYNRDHKNNERFRNAILEKLKSIGSLLKQTLTSKKKK